MGVELNHTIVGSKDKFASATFLTALLDLPEPTPYGPFMVVQLDNGVSLDFVEHDGEITSAHYAFLVAEADFDAALGRLREGGITYFADPHHREPGEINTNDGGRGFYFADPNGHNLELITRPYGSGE